MPRPSLRPLNRVRAYDLVFGGALLVWLAVQIGQLWWFPGSNVIARIHVGLAAVMVTAGLLGDASRDRRWLGVAAMASVLYLALYVSPFERRLDFLFPAGRNFDMAMGAFLLLVTTVLVWRSFGVAFALVMPLFIAFAFLGVFAPEPFTVPPYGLVRTVERVTGGVAFGALTAEVADYLWFLIFWGMLIEVSGAGRFIRLVAVALARKIRAGPALAAVVSSAVVGSFTGTGSANVTTTGPITIPMMRQAGYRPHQAAGIEAAASTAAGITPPIMGIVPFIMADMLSVPYTTVLKMVLLVALIWYLTVFVYVIALSGRLQLRPLSRDGWDVPARGEALRSAVLMVAPVAGLLIFIMRNHPLLNAVTYAFAILVVLAVVLRVERRPYIWWRGVRRAAIVASAFTMAMVAIQAITELMYFTTLIIKAGAIVGVVGGGNILVAGLVVFAFGVVVGGPLPPLAVFFLMALTFAPVFYEIGLPPAVTLFTAFYMGVLGTITPPVGPSGMVAAGIAGARFWDTAVESMKVAVAAFFIPFVVLLAPELLLSAPRVPAATPGHVLLVFSAVSLSLSALAVAFAGWLAFPLGRWPRLAFASTPVLMMIGLYVESTPLLWATVAVVLAIAGALAMLARADARMGAAAGQTAGPHPNLPPRGEGT